MRSIFFVCCLMLFMVFHGVSAMAQDVGAIQTQDVQADADADAMVTNTARTNSELDQTNAELAAAPGTQPLPVATSVESSAISGIPANCAAALALSPMVPSEVAAACTTAQKDGLAAYEQSQVQQSDANAAQMALTQEAANRDSAAATTAGNKLTGLGEQQAASGQAQQATLQLLREQQAENAQRVQLDAAKTDTFTGWLLDNIGAAGLH